MPKLLELAQKLDFPMQALLAKIEARGVKIDTNGLNQMSQELTKDITDLEQEIFDFVGQEFNIASPAQLSTVLFDKLQLPTSGVKRNRTGYSTDKKELDKLKGLHPIIDKISQFREVSKLKNTYVDVLPKLVDENSLLHTSLHQDVTATGRLSSTEPNLQNIPIRTSLGQKIREYFIAKDGKVLVSADYSQFELRLAAAMAGDQQLVDDFNDDSVDIHTKTAADAYGIPIDKVTPNQRRNAKVINFGVLYGMSPHGLSAATGMNYSDSKTFIEKYFEARRPIQDYLQAIIKKAETDGYVETLFGRRRATPNLKSYNFAVREAAKRAAANMPIQGTEADLMKMAMLKLDQELSDSAPQILQSHDSVLVECSPADAQKVGAKMKEIMENIYPEIGVKLKVDIKSGKNWGDL
jgi:DNA polymerase-1